MTNAVLLPDVSLFEMGDRDRVQILAAGRLLGRSSGHDAKSSPRSLFEVLPFELATLVAETLRCARERGQPLSFSHALPGSPAHLVEVMVFPYNGEGGLCLVQSRADSEAERFLRGQSELVEQTPVITMRLSPSAELEYFNAASASLVHGLGVRCGDPLPDAFRAAERVAREKGERGFEYSVNDRNYFLRTLPLDETGAGSWLIYGYENTGEKAAQLLVQEQFRRLGSFTSQIIHDINNPLATVMGSAEVALAKLARTPPADAATVLPLVERILKAALKLDQIIKSIRRPS